MAINRYENAQINRYENAPTVTVTETYEDDSDFDDDDDSDYSNDDFKQDLAGDTEDDEDFDDEVTPTPVAINNKAANKKNNAPVPTTQSTEGFTSEGYTTEGFTSESYEPFANAPKKGKKSKVNPTELSFRAYIYKVLKQVHPDTGVSKKAMNQVNSLIQYVFEIIVEQANRLLRMGKTATITSRDIQYAVLLVLPGEIAKHAVSDGSKAVTKFSYNEEEKKKSKKRVTKSKLAGLQFPVGRIFRMMKLYLNGPRVGAGAPIYLAAVMEYLAAEVLELSGNAARDAKHNRITPRDIFLAIHNDTELASLLNKLVVLNGGTHQYILPDLLPKRDENGRLVKTKKTKTKKSAGAVSTNTAKPAKATATKKTKKATKESFYNF